MSSSAEAAAQAAAKAGSNVKRVGKYEIGRTLGEGTFGKVKYAVNTETGEKVAIKILDKEKIQKQNMGAQIKKEISIMKMVKHENVVKLYEVLASRTKIFIVLELITGGELFDKIVAEGKFDENKARFYFRQLIKGVKYCHSQGVCHRDLKPENLLLDLNANLKISDFGLSALYTGSADDEGRATLLHTTCGTPNYVAPEVLNDKGYDGRAADIWSGGVILYVLLAGFLPFDEPHMSALFRKIQRAEYTYPSWFTPQVRRLLDKILVADPLKRATIADIEADPWFIGPDGLGIAGADIPINQALGLTPAVVGGAAGGAAPAAAPAPATINAVTLAHVPSSKDIDDAVQELDEGPTPVPAAAAAHHAAPASPAPAAAPAAVASPAGGAGAMPTSPAAPAAAADGSGGAQSLNAFEVISMFGGMALNRLLDVVPGNAGGSASGGSRAGGSGGGAGTQFLTVQPARVVLGRLQAALGELHADVRTEEGSCKVKGVLASPRGEISLVAVVHRLSDELHLVEVRRGKGDILEYNALATKLREKVADLVARVPSSARLVSA